MGFTGSAADLLDKYGNLYKSEASRVGKPAPRITRFSTQVLGQATDGWKLSRYTVGTKYIPLVGSIIGLTMSSVDFTKSFKSGDDAYLAQSIAIVSSLAGIGAVFFLGGFLGPIGIGIAILGYLASKFIWKEDNVIGEWLDHGPFARDNGGMFMVLAESQVKWAPTKHPNLYKGIENTLTIEGDDFWCEKDAKLDNVLRIKFGGQYVVFDKNYTLLGIHDVEPSTVNVGMQTIDVSAFPKSYLNVKDNQLFLEKQPIGELGKPFANTAPELRRRMQKYYSETTGITPRIDRSERFDAGFSAWGDTDEKFTIPFKKFPEASIEALLNATYPLKIALNMYHAKGEVQYSRSNIHHRGGAIVGDTREGNNVSITIDVPYFLEGQSKLIVELREERGWFENKNRYECQVVPMFYDKTTKESQYRIEVDTVVNLREFKDEHKKIVSENVEYKLYKSAKNGIAQVIIVANIDPTLIHNFEESLVGGFELEAWARLSINGAGETETTAMADGKEVKALWMPYRSAQGWADYEEGFTREVNLSQFVFGPGQPAKDVTAYYSSNEDWVSSSASDRYRGD